MYFFLRAERLTVSTLPFNHPAPFFSDFDPDPDTDGDSDFDPDPDSDGDSDFDTDSDPDFDHDSDTDYVMDVAVIP